MADLDFALDTEVTYADGKATGAVHGNVDSATTKALAAVDGVMPGYYNNAGVVVSALDTYRAFVKQKGNAASRKVSNLGAKTSQTATTYQDAENENTAAHNRQTGHAVSTATGFRRPITDV